MAFLERPGGFLSPERSGSFLSESSSRTRRLRLSLTLIQSLQAAHSCGGRSTCSTHAATGCPKHSPVRLNSLFALKHTKCDKTYARQVALGAERGLSGLRAVLCHARH